MKPSLAVGVFFLLLIFKPFTATAGSCSELAQKADKEKARIPGYMSGRKVIGRGRAYFYAAPDAACRLKATFVIPNDIVQAYFDVKGYTEVTYWDAKANAVTGWIPNSRLVETGTGIGPREEQ
jgi:hypothetical protein